MRQFEREKKTTRDAFGNAVHELAREDASIIGMGADTTNNLGMKNMSEEFPERVINIGIAEQNMMGVAARPGSHGLSGVCRLLCPLCGHALPGAVPYLHRISPSQCKGSRRYGRAVSRKMKASPTRARRIWPS